MTDAECWYVVLGTRPGHTRDTPFVPSHPPRGAASASEDYPYERVFDDQREQGGQDYGTGARVPH